MKKVILGLVLVMVVVLSIGCAPTGKYQQSPSLIRSGVELDLSGAKIIMLNSDRKDEGFNEEEVIYKVNIFLSREDVDIITFSRFYKPDTSRLIRVEIVYRDIVIND